MEQILSIINSPMFITALAGAIVFGLNALYAKKPLYKKYEGYLITAVKMAEKHIVDDTKNRQLARFDHALKYILDVYKTVEGKTASDKVKSELGDAINITHHKLDKNPLSKGGV